MDRTLTVAQGGQERELTIEEALQLKTYEEAIKGSRMAQREVLKMITKREQALALRAPGPPPPSVRAEIGDPRNADKAMILLGIAELDHDPYPRLLLKTWAIQAALGRRGRRSLAPREVSEVRRCAEEPDGIRWPKVSPD